MYFELMGQSVDLEITPETCVGELIEALNQNGLLDPALMKAQGMMFVNKKDGSRTTYKHATESQKTIAELGLVGDVIYQIVPDNQVA